MVVNLCGCGTLFHWSTCSLVVVVCRNSIHSFWLPKVKFSIVVTCPSGISSKWITPPGFLESIKCTAEPVHLISGSGDGQSPTIDFVFQDCRPVVWGMNCLPVGVDNTSPHTSGFVQESIDKEHYFWLCTDVNSQVTLFPLLIITCDTIISFLFHFTSDT